MSRHRMTLRGPWDCFPLHGLQTNDPLPLRVKMPAEWCELFGEQSGTARFERRFGRPTNLTERHRVFVVMQEAGGDLRAFLNDEPLTPTEDNPREWELTGRLQPRNLLAVEVSFDPALDPQARGGLWGLVALEISEA